MEDDEELGSLVAEYLADNGLQVEIVADGADADAAARSLSPALVILDLMLPNKDGLQICRELRVWYKGPILFLTARTGWIDEIVRLELGADDYLGKPVEPRLLLARVRSLLRRTEGFAAAEPSGGTSPSLKLDPSKRTAHLGRRLLDLTDAEFDMLAYLQAHKGKQLTREQLSRDVLEIAYDGIGRTIDVRMGRLRTKLGDDGKSPRWIKSIRGVGYLFVEPGD